jgi:integrase
MSRPRPPYLLHERTRHGAMVWYVRKFDGPRIRIRGEYGSESFMAEYHAAVSGEAVLAAKPRAPDTESLEWLIKRYRESSDWAKLSMATRKARENLFKNMAEKSGDLPYSAVTSHVVLASREERKDTPAMANNVLKATRGLFKWACQAGLVEDNPTTSTKLLTLKSDGFSAWTDDEVSRFEARWPVGTRERLALDILLYTGLRRGDAVRLGSQNVRAGVFRIKTEKSGHKIEVAAPILPALRRSIEATPRGERTFIAGLGGEPMAKGSFGNWFRSACDAAGVRGAAHGLRKAGASRAAENGATNEQLKAIFGWADDKMPSLYTRSANRARLAASAMKTLERDDEPDSPNPAP